MRRDASQIPGFRVFLQPIQNINFGARQTRTQFLYTLQGLNLDELYEWSQRLEQRLAEQSGNFRFADEAAPVASGGFQSLDDETRKNLESLGYVK